jgi:glycosyltransferase involved in cell wall biosynthesis
VFYVGTYNKDYYLQCGLMEEQLIKAPHAVDNDRFSKDKSFYEAEALKERRLLGITDDMIVFLYAGKFYPIKNIDFLIRTFSRLKGSEYRLLLYGNGKQESELKLLASSDERIIFQPFRNQSEMPWVYRTGDLFVLPSQHETWGLSINEAMACGRAAIVSHNCGCAPDLIIPGKTGYIFQSMDEAHLEAVMAHIKSRQEAIVMGENAFRFIQDYSLERIAEAIEAEVLA